MIELLALAMHAAPVRPGIPPGDYNGARYEVIDMERGDLCVEHACGCNVCLQRATGD
jgi:hypothetical protein